jgi:hypothetical protein
MAISLNTVDELQEHLLGVFERSAHHAGEVDQVLLSLIGGLLWRKKPGDPIKVNTKEGAGGNVIWFRVDSIRYALLYSHEERFIKLMGGGRKGELVQTFTNDTPISELIRVFASLGNGVQTLAEARKVRKEDRDPNAPKVKVAKADKPAKADKVAAKKLKADKPKKPKDRAAKEARLKARDEKVRQHREERKAVRQANKANKAAETPDPEALDDQSAPTEAPVAGTTPRLRAVEPTAAAGG